MRITFVTGKEPAVKFSDAEKKALTTVEETFRCYAHRMGRKDAIANLLAAIDNESCAIGLKEKTDDAK